jgi:transposase InsO family protein
MRYSQAEKLEIIRLVEGSERSVTHTLEELGVPRSTFYTWYKRYQEEGDAGLANRQSQPGVVWNRIPDEVRGHVVEVALDYPDKSPCQLAWFYTDTHRYFVSESSVYRILKARDLVASPVFQIVTAADTFENPTTRVNEMWQIDFSQFKVTGWGWYYLCTVLDDFSRYILAWRLAKTMNAGDARKTLDIARRQVGIPDEVPVRDRPRLLSDNGSAFVSSKLRTYLDRYHIEHVRGTLYHPQTQGKIERYHRSLKNIIKLENYYFPWELKQAVASFVTYYNQHRYHEALDNMTPADVYFGREKEVQSQREEIKRQTLRERRWFSLQLALQITLSNGIHVMSPDGTGLVWFLDYPVLTTIEWVR